MLAHMNPQREPVTASASVERPVEPVLYAARERRAPDVPLTLATDADRGAEWAADD